MNCDGFWPSSAGEKLNAPKQVVKTHGVHSNLTVVNAKFLKFLTISHLLGDSQTLHGWEVLASAKWPGREDHGGQDKLPDFQTISTIELLVAFSFAATLSSTSSCTSNLVAYLVQHPLHIGPGIPDGPWHLKLAVALHTGLGTSDWLWHPRLALSFQTASGAPNWRWHPRLALARPTGPGTPDWHKYIKSILRTYYSNFK